MTQIPRIISVDDHVVEPPDLWSSRLPDRYEERGPRIVRERGSYDVAKTGLVWTAHNDGEWADVWHYDGMVSPLMKLSAAAGFDELGFGAVTFDQIRPGC
ncbi:MAG TPA: amidohydrolase, partial [Acidimicrobiales bacterium]